MLFALILLCSFFVTHATPIEELLSTTEMSHETFQSLTDEHKQYLNQAFNNCFDKPAYVDRFVRGERLHKAPYILSDLSNRLLLITFAQKLLRHCSSDDYICCLGQSPAWVVKTAQLLDSYPQRYTYIAFSGSWFITKPRIKRSRSIFNEGNYALMHTRPTKSQLSAYKAYLTRLGVSPTSIIERYKTHGRRTVIVEHIHDGNGLRSFLSILYGWAQHKRKELQQAMVIYLIAIRTLGEDYISDRLIQINANLTSCDEHLIHRLDTADCYEDRIVPRYKSHLWDKIDPCTYPVTRKVNLITYKMLDTIYSIDLV